MHPLVPEDQAEGYRELIRNLSDDLKIITGFAGVSPVSYTHLGYPHRISEEERKIHAGRKWVYSRHK